MNGARWPLKSILVFWALFPWATSVVKNDRVGKLHWWSPSKISSGIPISNCIFKCLSVMNSQWILKESIRSHFCVCVSIWCSCFTVCFSFALSEKLQRKSTHFIYPSHKSRQQVLDSLAQGTAHHRLASKI